MKRILVAILALAVAGPAAAAASQWRSMSGSSRLRWTAKWQGTPVKGSFPDFTVTAYLDADNPVGGKIKVRIDTRSVKSASADVTKAIRGAAWFDVSNYPRASFEGRLTGHRHNLRLRGALRLKGHRKRIVIRVKLRPRGSRRVELSGSFELDRGDFAIGSGQWRGGGMIAKTVAVDFSVSLVRRN